MTSWQETKAKLNDDVLEQRLAGAEPPRGFADALRRPGTRVIAVGASTGLYLVGSVYTGSYYGRMSMEGTALDLTPPFIALQAAHVVESLLQYPL